MTMLTSSHLSHLTKSCHGIKDVIERLPSPACHFFLYLPTTLSVSHSTHRITGD